MSPFEATIFLALLRNRAIGSRMREASTRDTVRYVASRRVAAGALNVR